MTTEGHPPKEPSILDGISADIQELFRDRMDEVIGKRSERVPGLSEQTKAIRVVTSIAGIAFKTPEAADAFTYRMLTGEDMPPSVLDVANLTDERLGTFLGIAASAIQTTHPDTI